MCVVTTVSVISAPVTRLARCLLLATAGFASRRIHMPTVGYPHQNETGGYPVVQQAEQTICWPFESIMVSLVIPSRDQEVQLIVHRSNVQ